jgi:hypothetical protein
MYINKFTRGGDIWVLQMLVHYLYFVCIRQDISFLEAELIFIQFELTNGVLILNTKVLCVSTNLNFMLRYLTLQARKRKSMDSKTTQPACFILT